MKTICIAGKNDIAVDVMLYCVEKYKDFNVVCVTNRTETGVNSWQKSLEWFANKNDVKIMRLENIYEIEDVFFLSTEFDRIVKPSLFKSDNLFNIHFSLLPKYKGVYTSVLPILYGEKETGVTFHRIRQGIDTGEIIDQEALSINENDSSYDLYKKLISLGTEVVIRNLDTVLSGKVSYKKQSKDNSTYYSTSSIDYSKLCLNINATAFQIKNQIRAYNFRPYQIIKWNNQAYISGEITDDISDKKAGAIIDDNELYTIISTIDYNVKLYKDVFTELMTLIRLRKNEAAKNLCSCSEVINSKDEHGWSPLVVATYNNNVEMVEFLIDCGADITVRNNNGTTLLMYAKDAGLKTSDWTIFKLLVKRGLDPKDKDYNSKSICDYLDSETLEKLPEEIRAIV